MEKLLKFLEYNINYYNKDEVYGTDSKNNLLKSFKEENAFEKALAWCEIISKEKKQKELIQKLEEISKRVNMLTDEELDDLHYQLVEGGSPCDFCDKY